MFARFVAALAVALITQGTFAEELRENEAIIGGGSSEADGLWVSSPSIYLRKNSPGLGIGMMRVSGKERSFAYLLVIKGDEARKSLARSDSQSSVSGLEAKSNGFVEIANQRATFAYRLKLDPLGKKPPQEVLSINGTDLEIGKGRVVLVDLSSEKVACKQLQMDLPKSPDWPTVTAAVESRSKKLLEMLRENQDVRNFLK